jgi:Icc-related predicted phosphoesterase
MRALVLSDLHLEFHGFETVHNGRRIDDGADVVVLAGDIAAGNDGIGWARRAFPGKEIVYVVGNHEFYGAVYELRMDDLRAAAEIEGVHFLERDRATISGITFLGATLWTDFKLFDELELSMEEAYYGLNDFGAIKTHLPRGDEEAYQIGVYPGQSTSRSRNFLPIDSAKIHGATIEWLSAELSTTDPERTIVVTHHAPHRRSVHPRFQADGLTPAFASNLEPLMGKSRYWVHGHMHDSRRYQVNGTEVVLNPRGYPLFSGGFENKHFDPTLQIEI